MGMKQHLLSELSSAQRLISIPHSAGPSVISPREVSVFLVKMSVSVGSWLWAPALLPMSYVVLGKLFNLFKSSFLIYKFRDTYSLLQHSESVVAETTVAHKLISPFV